MAKTPRPRNTRLILQLLTSFDGQNTPVRVSEWIKEQKISRSRGLGLVRAMLEAGLLERVEAGTVRLGTTVRQWFCHPLEGRLIQLRQQQEITPGIILPDRQSPTARHTLMQWSPVLLEQVETRAFARPAPYHIGIANASLSNSWRRAMLERMLYAAQRRESVIKRLSIKHAGDDPVQQIVDIDSLLAESIDLLIISAVHADHAPLSQKLLEVIEQGIPVIAVDRRPGDPAALTSFVTASDNNIGRISAIWIAERLKGKGTIWMLSGLQGASPTTRRQLAALQAFTEFPDIRITSIEYTQWRHERGYNVVQQLLASQQRVPDGVWCDSGLQGTGSIQAFLDAGMTVPPHTGGDINLMYKSCLRNRVPFVAIDYPTAMGSRSIETALQVLSGLPVPKRIETPLQIVLPRGMETYSVKADNWAEQHVDWQQDDHCMLSQHSGLHAELRTDWQEMLYD